MKQLTLISLFVFIYSFGFSQTTPSTDTFRDKVIYMLELQNSKQRFELVMNQLIDVQAPLLNTLPPDFAEELKAEIKKDGFSQLYDLLIPIYQEHLSEKEVDAIIVFYESPEGKSLIEKTPFIMQESMQVGRIWGEQLGQKIAERMLEEQSTFQIDSVEVLPPYKKNE
ncbi:MAG: DUF2059 domain-containing protein [Bacteroidota bacterium]